MYISMIKYDQIKSMFFKSNGLVLRVAFPKGRSIPGLYTKSMCWKTFRNAMKRRDQSLEISNIQLLLDNAPARLFLEKRKGS